VLESQPEFTLGIEEEYFLVDRATRDVVGDPPPEMLAECEALLGGQVSSEFLRSQIEVGTRVCASLVEARADLRRLRATVAEVAARRGLAPVAAATHPFARWDAQKTTERDRYASLHQDLQAVGRRLAICGLHVHIGIPDDELRIDLLNQASYFLPHLLALSTSSPFWQGENTGLKSYRLAVFDELPRTGTPERFASWGEYQRHVDILVAAGLIEDATKLWWDLRPSGRFPTLEMRITDSCTTLEDSLSIAALFRCLLRMLWRLKRENQRWRIYARMLVDENRWRAQRYGIDQGRAGRASFRLPGRGIACPRDPRPRHQRPSPACRLRRRARRWRFARGGAIRRCRLADRGNHGMGLAAGLCGRDKNNVTRDFAREKPGPPLRTSRRINWLG